MVRGWHDDENVAGSVDKPRFRLLLGENKSGCPFPLNLKPTTHAEHVLPLPLGPFVPCILAALATTTRPVIAVHEQQNQDLEELELSTTGKVERRYGC